MPGLDDLKKYLKDVRKSSDFYTMVKDSFIEGAEDLINPNVIDRYASTQDRYVSTLSRILNKAKNNKFENDKKIEELIEKTVSHYMNEAFALGKQTIIKGKTELTKLDKELLGKVVQREKEYFKDFVDEQTGKKKPKKKSIDPEKRLEMYRGALDGSMKKGMSSGVFETVGEDVEIWWDLSPFCVHCSSCLILSSMSPYTKKTLRTTPGAGDTKCGHSCKCKLRFVSKKTGKNLIATSDEDDGPYKYRTKNIPQPVKQAIDDEGRKINYYRQMAETAKTDEERNYYLKLRREANKNVIDLKKANNVSMTPKLSVQERLVPAVKSVNKRYPVVAHDDKSLVPVGKRVGVLRGTDYKIGVVTSNDNKQSLIVTFGNQSESVDFDKGVLFNITDRLDKKASKKAIKQYIDSTENASQSVIYTHLNTNIAITDATDIAKIKPFVKKNLPKKLGGKGAVVAKKMTKEAVEEINEDIVKAVAKDAVGELEPKFVPAKTVKEAEEWAVKNSVSQKVNYSKINDIGVVNRLNRQLFELKQQHGVVFDEIVSKNDGRKNAQMALMGNRPTIISGGKTKNTLQINNYTIENIAKNNIDQQMKKMHEEGWLVGKNFEDAINHEYGHLLTSPESYGAGVKMSKDIRKKTFKISKYAESHGDETLAEIFTLYKQGADLKPEWIDFFNKYSKVKI